MKTSYLCIPYQNSPNKWCLVIVMGVLMGPYVGVCVSSWEWEWEGKKEDCLVLLVT